MGEREELAGPAAQGAGDSIAGQLGFTPTGEPSDPDPVAEQADGEGVPGPLPGRVEEAVAAERAVRTRAAGRRACRYCGGALPPGKRADALDCSPDHRTRYHRERVPAETAAARDSGQVRLEQAQAVLGPLADQIAAAATGLRADLDRAVADTLAQAQAARADVAQARRERSEANTRAELADCRAQAAREKQEAAELEQRRAQREANGQVDAAKADARDAWAQVAEHERARGAAEQARDNALREREQAEVEQQRMAALLEEARRELDRLRAAAEEHARHAETLRAAAADADLARERAEHDSRQAQARAETAEGRAETARQEATQARLALAAAQGEAAAATRLQARAEEELRQAGTDRDLQRERAVAAEQQARAARAERDRDAEQVRELRDRLAAAQAAAGLVLPDLADLSGDLGDDVRGVRLPEVGIAVARQPDGAVVLHHQGRQIRLSDGRHAAAHGRALAAALLALALPRS
ncbi:hypothetical protein [Nonomuraea sp. NPDC005692]|uniref:hypothetical protein n=1 Tax=Nonomuraea sp. NPDC005692 TaxID=3157168 RepID=UPI0033D16723